VALGFGIAYPSRHAHLHSVHMPETKPLHPLPNSLEIVPGAPCQYDQCMSTANVIERALQLAPECGSIDELSRKLKREDYLSVEGHLDGRQIRSQIVPLLKRKPEHHLRSRS
jgi:hypothetical protein